VQLNNAMTNLGYFHPLVGKIILDVRQEISTTFPINDPDPDKILTEIPLCLSIDQFRLFIYNNWSLSGNITHIEMLIGRSLQNIKMDGHLLLLEVEGSIGISVDVSDEGFNGPEAIVLYGPDNLWVVWN
jgi:hypothetical protein